MSGFNIPQQHVNFRQPDVNRRNAQHSTGPRTEEGKQRSSMNALKHGAYSSAVLILGESEEELEGLREELHKDLRPVGPMESLLVDRIVLHAWRLERARRVERETLEHSMRQASYKASHLLEGLGEVGNYELPRPKPVEEGPAQVAFHWEEGSKLERLLRHEGQVERAMFKLLHELERMQVRRVQGGEAFQGGGEARAD